MSGLWSGHAWLCDVPPPQQLLLLFLADNCNEMGRCHQVSYARLAWATRLSRSTVIRHIKKLVEVGALKVAEEAEPVKSRAPTYDLHFEALPSKDTTSADAPRVPTPPMVTVNTPYGQDDHTPMVTVNTGGAAVDDASPYIEKHLKTISSSGNDDLDKIEALAQAYNDERGALPECQSVNDARHKALKKLLKRNNPEALLRRATRSAAADPFYKEHRYGIDTVLRHIDALAERAPEVAGGLDVGDLVTCPYGDGRITRIDAANATVRVTQPLIDHLDRIYEEVMVPIGDLHARTS